MKYLLRNNENGDGSTDILIGVKLTAEDKRGLELIAPDESFPDNYGDMNLDQILCWLRILISYAETWDNREKDYAKEIIARFIEEKKRDIEWKRQKISSKRRRPKPQRIKRTKRNLRV